MKHTAKSGKAHHASPQPKQIEVPVKTVPAKKRPTPEQIDEALKKLVAVRVEQFNADLAIARGMWRRNRKLVESPHWPEPYRTLYMGANDGAEPEDQESEKAPTIQQLRKEELAHARQIATTRANASQDAGLSPAAVNLMNECGALVDPPRTTYLLLTQSFEDGKDLEWLQDVELSYDEYQKLRRYLAELRGLIPAKAA